MLRRPTVDGAPPNLHLHGLYAGDRETPHPAALSTLPKLASGLSGASHTAGTPSPSLTTNAAFSLYWPVGLTGGGSLRDTPHPAAPAALPKLTVGPAGTTHTAGNSTPSRAAPLHLLDCFFPVTGFLCKTFGTGEGKMRGKRGGKF